MRLIVLMLALFVTPVMAASIKEMTESPKRAALEEPPQSLKDKIIAVAKRSGKLEVLEGESKCESEANDEIICHVFFARNDLVMIYGNSSRVLGVRVIPNSNDFLYVIVATLFAVNLDKDLTPFSPLARSLAQSLSDEKKYTETRDGIIYRVSPWYVKEFKKSFLVVEIERE